MKIDIDSIVAEYFGPAEGARAPQAEGLRELLTFMAGDMQIADARWAAYMLATVKHECADRWKPMVEFGRGQGHAYGEPVSVTDGSGNVFVNRYYGRGYVQLTWQKNYNTMGPLVGLGLRLNLHPILALDPQIAYKVMSVGMRHGIFTGQRLERFINADVCDYVNARRVINGADRAELIAGYAIEFEKLLASNSQTDKTPNNDSNAPGVAAATPGKNSPGGAV